MTTSSMANKKRKARKRTAKKSGSAPAAAVKKNEGSAPAAKKKTAKKAAKKKNGDNPFASKLDDKAGEKIEAMFQDGLSWKEIAAELGVSVSSVRFRFLNYLIDYVYGGKPEAEDAE